MTILCATGKRKALHVFIELRDAAVIDPLAGNKSKLPHAFTFVNETKPAALHVKKGTLSIFGQQANWEPKGVDPFISVGKTRGELVNKLERSVSVTQELPGSCLRASFLVKRKRAAMLWVLEANRAVLSLRSLFSS